MPKLTFASYKSPLWHHRRSWLEMLISKSNLGKNPCKIGPATQPMQWMTTFFVIGVILDYQHVSPYNNSLTKFLVSEFNFLKQVFVKRFLPSNIRKGESAIHHRFICRAC